VTLLEMETGDDDRFASCTDALAFLWDHDRVGVLACAAATEARTHRLAAVLAEVCRLLKEEIVRDLYLSQLREAEQAGQPEIIRATATIRMALATGQKVDGA
jgi:hypothetical protein